MICPLNNFIRVLIIPEYIYLQSPKQLTNHCSNIENSWHENTHSACIFCVSIPNIKLISTIFLIESLCTDFKSKTLYTPSLKDRVRNQTLHPLLFPDVPI
jgi:hypothetical protein